MNIKEPERKHKGINAKIMKIMSLALEISPANAEKKDGQSHVFVDYLPHCNQLILRVYRKGWKSNIKPDYKADFCDKNACATEKADEMIAFLENLKEKGKCLSGINEKIIKIMSLALEISPADAEKKDGQPHVFVNYAPHCNQLKVEVYLKGWSDDKKADYKECIYCDESYADEKADRIIAFLENEEEENKTIIMTETDFEKKYGKKGAVKVEMDMYYSTIRGLIPYFNKMNRLRESVGDEPYTLEEYIATVLQLGCIHTMKCNAELYASSAEAYYNNKKKQKNNAAVLVKPLHYIEENID